jgi:hypothetical protein
MAREPLRAATPWLVGYDHLGLCRFEFVPFWEQSLAHGDLGPIGKSTASAL